MLCPATANSCDPSGLKGLSLIWAPFSLILGVALLPLVIWSAPCPCDVDMHEWGTSSLTWVSLQPGVHALGLLMSLTAPRSMLPASSSSPMPLDPMAGLHLAPQAALSVEGCSL